MSGGISGGFDSLIHFLLTAKLGAYGFYATFWFLHKATSPKGNKEPKLTTLTALILTYYMVFHKFLY